MRASHKGGLGLWGPLGIHAHIHGFYGDFRGAVLPSNYVASLSARMNFLDDMKFQQAPVLQGQINGNHKGSMPIELKQANNPFH